MQIYPPGSRRLAEDPRLGLAIENAIRAGRHGPAPLLDSSDCIELRRMARESANSPAGFPESLKALSQPSGLETSARLACSAASALAVRVPVLGGWVPWPEGYRAEVIRRGGIWFLPRVTEATKRSC
jgi:hypothetical protein